MAFLLIIENLYPYFNCVCDGQVINIRLLSVQSGREEGREGQPEGVLMFPPPSEASGLTQSVDSTPPQSDFLPQD